MNQVTLYRRRPSTESTGPDMLNDLWGIRRPSPGASPWTLLVVTTGTAPSQPKRSERQLAKCAGTDLLADSSHSLVVAILEDRGERGGRLGAPHAAGINVTKPQGLRAFSTTTWTRYRWRTSIACAACIPARRDDRYGRPAVVKASRGSCRTMAHVLVAAANGAP